MRKQKWFVRRGIFLTFLIATIATLGLSLGKTQVSGRGKKVEV